MHCCHASPAPRCTFQKTEAQNGAKITRVVCATDCKAVGWLFVLGGYNVRPPVDI